MVAIEAILARPHRLLTAEEEFVPIHQVHEVDADVVLSILTNPQHWVKCQRAGLAVAERLGGYAPQKVWQRLAVETFDTPENRFVKWFVGELLSWVEKLLAWTQFPDSARDEFVELKGQLEMALHDPLFVAETRPFSTTIAISAITTRGTEQSLALLHLSNRGISF